MVDFTDGMDERLAIGALIEKYKEAHKHDADTLRRLRHTLDTYSEDIADMLEEITDER